MGQWTTAAKVGLFVIVVGVASVFIYRFVSRTTGTEGGYGEELGLARDWAARIIRHVGNYGEVYDRNVGVDSELGIPRGLNQLWNAGGILYAPPIR